MTSIYAINDPLADIYNEGQWRINKVSPMHNLQRSVIKLKQYASKIRHSLVSTVTAYSCNKFTVTLTDLPHLKYSEEDPNGLAVTVSTNSSQDANKTKVSYVAIFLSWGQSECVDGASHLPYMLDRGEQKIGTTVKSMLQTLFDCNIKQIYFTQNQLLQFGFNLVENDTSRSNDSFTLSYKIPHVNFKNKLNLTFEVGDVHIIWSGVKHVKKESEQVNLAYQIFQNQIFHMMMLDVTVFELCEVTLPKAEVKSTGLVKMKTPEAVNCVFTVLNEISSMHEMTLSDLTDR